MKCFAVAFFICVLSVSASEGAFTAELKTKLTNHHKECLKSTSLDPKIVEKALVGEFSNDPLFKKYLLCLKEHMGFLDASGVIQKSVIVQKLGEIIDNPALAAKVTDECLTGKTTDAIVEIIKCYYSKLPNIAGEFL